MSLLRKAAPVSAAGISVESAQAAINQRKTERFEFLARFLKGRKGGASLIQKNLVTAGLMLKPTEFLMANIIFAVLFICVGILWIGGWTPDYSIVGIIKRLGTFGAVIFVGWRLPQWVLGFMANKRRTTLEYQLTDALTIISSGLKGGYSFIQGLTMASEQLEPPIKDEFIRVIRLVQLGLETSRALESMSERVNSYDYDMTVSATNIQLAVGGNLSQLLEGIANTIRDRIRLRRDIAALTAQGRMSGGILIALPLGIAFMLKIINPDYMRYLFDFPLGNNLLILAGIQQGIGIYWIKKLLDFDN